MKLIISLLMVMFVNSVYAYSSSGLQTKTQIFGSENPNCSDIRNKVEVRDCSEHSRAGFVRIGDRAYVETYNDTNIKSIMQSGNAEQFDGYCADSNSLNFWEWYNSKVRGSQESQKLLFKAFRVSNHPGKTSKGLCVYSPREGKNKNSMEVVFTVFQTKSDYVGKIVCMRDPDYINNESQRDRHYVCFVKK